MNNEKLYPSKKDQQFEDFLSSIEKKYSNVFNEDIKISNQAAIVGNQFMFLKDSIIPQNVQSEIIALVTNHPEFKA